MNANATVNQNVAQKKIATKKIVNARTRKK